MSEPIDLACGHYGLNSATEELLQALNEKHLKNHPTCEICDSRPSVRIIPIGALRAACLECIADIRREVDEQIQEEIEADAADHPWIW